MTPALSIIVPIKVADVRPLAGLADCYRALLASRDDLELIVPDDSPRAVFEQLDAAFRGLGRVDHYRPDATHRTGSNGKTNGVRSAVARCSSRYVLLLDDDFRPTPRAIELVVSRLRPGCVVSTLTYQLEPTLGDRIDRSGMLVGFGVEPDRPYLCGNLAFDLALAGPGFPTNDALFDENATVRELTRLGATYDFVRAPWLPIAPHAAGKILQQRVRYGYELLGRRELAAFYLALLPALIGGLAVWPAAALTGAAALSGVYAVLALIGSLRNPGLAPRFTWLAAPLFLWSMALGMWGAVGYYLTGGMPFGGQRVRRPA